ncbi:carbohydrate-binding protein [Deminuibacter soli]|uniref:Carbohydrate-binding protein n=1 Tax=Deminuibacter soli TaxID=2291815 RepID=A0A3E1NDY9_9BACT|nr:carbohydrate-binding protein [Deminuibacter soli]RFM26183.1 carbohydrate-binding protein [Deminuibacter soli]
MNRVLRSPSFGRFYRVLFILLLFGAHTSCAIAQKWRLIQPAFATSDAPVIGYSVADYGATGDGATDVTGIFQQRLDSLGLIGGGTLFVPTGKYVIKGRLRIPKGVTLRGEWQQPVKGQPVKGTILMAYAGRGNETSEAFISVASAAAVMDLAIWYPEQTPDNITPYPPAIGYGNAALSYTSNGNTTRNVTLVNAYSGVVCIVGGSVPNINGLYGTPLSRGVEIDGIADVGHIESIHFAPGYWSGSGLPNAPAAGSSFESWIKQHGTGFVMRRNDWTYTSFMDIEGYHIGYHAAPSVLSPGTVPNAQNYAINLTNCETGIYAEGISGIGVLFSRVITSGCTNGLAIGGGSNSDGTLQLHTCTISGSQNAVKADSTCLARIIMQQCTIGTGKVDIGGGTFMPSDCDFNNAAPQIVLQSKSRGLVTANRFKNAKSIQNNSDFVGIIDSVPVTLPHMPAFPSIVQGTHQPARKALYVVTDAPFNARHDGVTDNTSAVQAALNKAAADGGGIVFLPPGKYEFNGHLSVPAGVELKGASDISALPMSQGAILEPHADKNVPTGTPFITLAANSGIRGLTINYPEQTYAANYPANIISYPYAIRASGANVYIVNIAMRAVYQGIDLFTNKCDNHYVDFITGQFFKSVIRVGGGSAGGQISNAQVNPIAFAVGGDDEWGNWPNSAPSNNNGPVYTYNHSSQDFLTLGNCSNEVLFNNFVFGPANGVLFLSEGAGASGICHGMEIDGSSTAINLQGMGTAGFDFIDAGAITTKENDADTGTSNFKTSASFASRTFNLYNGTFTGYPGQSFIMNGGTINLQGTGFIQAGNLRFADIKSGRLNMHNASVWPVPAILKNGEEANFSVRSSIMDSTGIVPAKTAAFKNNLGNAYTVVIKGALDRHGWTAFASSNTRAAQNALDSTDYTRWDSNAEQVPGQTFTVDMKTINTIHRVVLDATQSINDFPAGYEVRVAKDTLHWSNPVASDNGLQGMTLITFPDTACRYVRVTQTGYKGGMFWSIHEFYAFGKVNVTGISIPLPIRTIKPDSAAKLAAVITPAIATNKAVTWTSDNTAVATVDTAGKVHAVGGGTAIIRVTSVDAGIYAVDTVTVPVGLSPYLGAPYTIPGIVEAENFDNGGQGVAYFDNDSANKGGNQYRPSESVDAEVCGEGGYDVGSTEPGEWMKYTVNVLKDGVYTLEVRAASPNNGSKLQVEMDGVNISGTVNLPNTGGWQTYQSASVTTPLLKAGQHILRIVIGSYGFNLNYVRFLESTSRPVKKAAAEAKIVVYPNPVTTGTIGLQLTNLPAGKYQVILVNNLYQPVLQTQLTVTSGVANYSWPLTRNLPAGYYHLQLVTPQGTHFTQPVLIP